MTERKSTQAHIDANARYNKKTYEQIMLIVRKDSDLNGDAIRDHVIFTGESINAFISRAIAETVERDNQRKKCNAGCAE